MDLSSQLEPARARPDASRQLPPGVEVETPGNTMRLVVRHGARDRFPGLGLVAPVAVLAYVWYHTGGSWSRVAEALEARALGVALEDPELLLELAVILLGPLLALAVYLVRRPSRTVVTVTPDGLDVRRSLLPMIGTTHFDRMDLDQFYSKEVGLRMTGIDREEHERGEVISYTYELRVRLQDRSDRLVVDGLWRADQALFLEQRLEEFLHLPDRPVPMELERS
jgi:hypothetical protein